MVISFPSCEWCGRQNGADVFRCSRCGHYSCLACFRGTDFFDDTVCIHTVHIPAPYLLSARNWSDADGESAE